MDTFKANRFDQELFHQHFHYIAEKLNQITLTHFLKMHIHNASAETSNFHKMVREKFSRIFAEKNHRRVGKTILGKQNMYDHSLHVPLLFAGPGIAAGREVTDFCYLNDIFPTLCDLTGFEAPDGLEGQSIACLLEAEPSRGNSSSADDAPPRMDASSQSQAASSRQELLFAYKNIQRAVLDAAGNKYIIYFNEDGSIKREQLFNLQQDPLELKDLIYESDSERTIELLRSSMKNLMRSMDDPMLSQI